MSSILDLKLDIGGMNDVLCWCGCACARVRVAVLCAYTGNLSVDEGTDKYLI